MISVGEPRTAERTLWSIFGLYAIFVFLYFPVLTSVSLTIDDEFTAFRTWPWIWAAQGRWGVYLFEKLIHPNPVVPYLTIALFGLFVTLALFTILKTFGMERLNGYSLALTGVALMTPTWFFIVEFSGNTAPVGLGFLLAAAAVGAFSRMIEQRFGVAWGLAAAACLACAAGLYQSIIIVAVIVSSALVFERYLRGGTLSSFVAEHLQLAAVTVAGLALYLALDLGFLSFLQTERYYIDAYWRPEVFLEQPFQTLGLIAREYARLAWGYGALYGTSPMWALGLFMASCAGVVVFRAWAKSWTALALSIAWLVGAFVVCFALYLVSGDLLPYRTQIPLVALVFSLGLLAAPVARRSVILPLTVIAAISIFQGSALLSKFAANQQFVAQRDQVLAGDVYRAIMEAGGRDVPRPIRVAIHGKIDGYPLYELPVSSYSSFSWFELHGGDSQKIAHFMSVLGYRVQTVTAEEMTALEGEWEGQPSWPMDGYVRRMGDVFLVKLSD